MAVRKNQKDLSRDEKTNLLMAWQNLNFNGPLVGIVAEHSYSAHVLHSGDAPPDFGSWRFLPWHRLYLYLVERALQLTRGGGVPDTSISIPYWDWSNPADQAIPDWLVNATQRVGNIDIMRSPGKWVKTLPPREDADKLKQINTYIEFTQCLEMGNGCPAGHALDFKSGMHNQVHNWVGGTMNSGDTAPADIIFWMHHANVDRIWSEWQNQHPNEYPNGLGCKLDPKAACDPVTIPGHDGYAWVLDPHQLNEPDCRSIQQLGYSYV